jgi:hypothetical protein
MRRVEWSYFKTFHFPAQPEQEKILAHSLWIDENKIKLY